MQACSQITQARCPKLKNKWWIISIIVNWSPPSAPNLFTVTSVSFYWVKLLKDWWELLWTTMSGWIWIDLKFIILHICQILPSSGKLHPPNIQVFFIFYLVYRKGLIQGVVHDPTAYLFGGVAGHAGIFSTADDLVKYMQVHLNKGVTRSGKRVYN